MDERKMLAVLVTVQALQCATAMYFHEPSSVLVQGLGAENDTEFGFAMAYMSNLNSLVVGAPNATQIGTLFSCEPGRAGDMNIISCNEQNIDYLDSDYNTDKFPKQRFHLGASIVAASDYFFTCAPLWTTNVKAPSKRSATVTRQDSFGTCFVQNDTETLRYQGLLEFFMKPKEERKVKRSFLRVERFTGGTGWSTLIDEENDLLLIAKSSPPTGDFYYVPASNPSLDVKSLADQDLYSNYLPQHWNIGFGLTAGKFFSNETMYAFSMLEKNMEGLISFLIYNKKYNKLSVDAASFSEAKHGNFITVASHAVGAMFGNAMSSADLNFDELDELLVGAPAQSEDECCECGALHIYIGGDKHTINEPYRLRSIFGTVEFGRFGSAIVTKDVDGDGKLEIIVSAPYENHGSGTIYILSGNEVYHTLMESQEFKSIQLSDLKLTQKIQKESYKTLGFSLQFIDDVDGNGCDELAAGSPASSSVLIFKCVRKVTVEISTRLLGNQLVREQDMNFTVEVCASVEYPLLPDEIIGNVIFENSINGSAATVLQPSIVIDISCDSCFNRTEKYCENVTVSLNDKDPGAYIFESKADLQNTYLTDPNATEFNKTWVEASLYSKLDASLVVHRRCNGDDCKSQLSTKEIHWSGSDPYLLGSSANETVTITVKNDGNASYSACVRFKVTGATVGTVGCKLENNWYKCDLPTPMKRETNFSINVELIMSEPTKNQKCLRVTVHLYENCDQERYSETEESVPYNLTLDGIFDEGDTHGINITDKQILDNAMVYDHHEFVIRNYGKITWEAVGFTISMEKKPYINSFHISTANCTISNDKFSLFIIHNCTLDLFPNTTNTIIGTTEILAGQLNGYENGAKIETEYLSILSLFDLFSRVPDLNITTSVTTITIQKELTWASRKWLIALIAGIIALILIAILAYILYKKGFFKRKQKQKLIVKQESERRKSVRRNTHASAMDGPMEGLQIDVIDDSPFEEARPVTSKDNVGLVENS